MKAVTLTVSELIDLSAEIHGVNAQNKQTGETLHLLKGLRWQKISQLLKFHLDDIVEEARTYKERVETLKKEVLEKYGTRQEDGSIVLTADHPEYEKITKELQEVLDQKIEIIVYPFQIESFDFNEEEYYPNFYKLIRKISKA